MALTETAIRSLATEESYQKGEDYYYTNAITQILQRGETLLAEVQGSDYEPYHVTITFSAAGIAATTCTCPYNWGGICKHRVAVLLMAIRQPERIEVHPSIQELLAAVSEAHLRTILTDVLTAEPRLIAYAEAKLATLNTKEPANTPTAVIPGVPFKPAAPRPTLIDPASFRRQVQQILRSADYRDDYGASWELADQITRLLTHVQPFLDAGDGQNALLVLRAIIEPMLGCWFNYDQEGEFGDVFAEAGPLFTEALLCADVAQADRREWQKRLAKWQNDLSEYGCDGVFDAAIAAAGQGWDYPPLQAVLQGKISEKGAWADEIPMYADDLAAARLRVLERQGRTQEYLYLAEAEGQTALYLTMLVKTGQIAEAVAYARQYADMTDEILSLAQALALCNHMPEAIQIAEFGLELQGDKLALARWLRDTAANQQAPEVALRAAKIAFTQSYAMQDYQAAETLAGPTWPMLKPELLHQLATASYALERLDIYLHENMFTEAMAYVDQKGNADYQLVGKVVDAVWEREPEWAIRHCQQQAEAIMDAGKSKYYAYAIRWLEKASRAYQVMNRQADWDTYMIGLVQKHARKTSLRPQLEQLRQYHNRL